MKNADSQAFTTNSKKIKILRNITFSYLKQIKLMIMINFFSLY